MTDMTLTREDTGTHAVVRVLDGHLPAHQDSKPTHMDAWDAIERDAAARIAALAEGQAAQAQAEARNIIDEVLHEHRQVRAEIAERVRREGTVNLPPAFEEIPPVWAELPGTELPRRQYTADDIAALLGVDLLVKARWDLNAMRNPDAVARVNEGLRRLWPVQPDSVNTPEPDPVAAYMAADDPDERPGRTVVLAPRDNPLAQAYARTAGHAQRQDAIRRAAQQGTATGQYVAPALRPRGPRNPIARRVDGLFARVETWWRAKQTQRDQRMGVGE